MTVNAPLRSFARNRPAGPRSPWLFAAAVACGTALGALLEFFLDRRAGRRRRHAARDKALSRLRHTKRRTARRARHAESQAVGVVKRTLNARRAHPGPVDDIELAHKVESELFRHSGIPKGKVAINAEEGVVFLRGIVERQEEIDGMITAAARLEGVRGVENLLHLPGTPAPASRPRLLRERDSAPDPS